MQWRTANFLAGWRAAEFAVQVRGKLLFVRPSIISVYSFVLVLYMLHSTCNTCKNMTRWKEMKQMANLEGKFFLHLHVLLYLLWTSVILGPWLQSFSTNLSMKKEGSLFCFVLYLWDPTNEDASDRVLSVFGKLLTTTTRGLGSMTFGLVVQELLNIE
jgi:hypothetical protein